MKRNKQNETKKQIVILVLHILFFCFKIHAQNNGLMLTTKYNLEEISNSLLDTSQWSSKINKEINWKDVPENLKNNIIENANIFSGKPIPFLSATLSLEYSINGNRTNYEEAWYERRNRLTKAVLAECIENKGRFLNEIVDVIWAICEESWWGFPAHHYQYGQIGLPNIEDEYVDLFAAETGALLAWTYFLLHKELNEVSQEINKRIVLEVRRRILKPNLEHQDFHWMGYNGEDLNNWTPWICSNWLTCVLFLEDDSDKRTESVYKIMTLLDRYLEPYPKDGGCDEGPAYWNRAGGALFDCLYLLEKSTNGEVAIWNEKLIKNIGSYIYKVYIKDDYYVNFADATAKVKPDAALVYEYGNKVSDSTMIQFGAWLAEKNKDNEPDSGLNGNNSVLNENIARQIRMIQINSKLKESAKNEPSIEQSWLPHSQIMLACEDAKTRDGFFIAVKGGHNKESHNHNDVGSFITYYDGMPVLIDLGLETYTKKSFSDKRYEIWITQSQYHNLPTINGEMQAPGRKFRATNVSCNSSESVFSLDIASAYPEAAHVSKWQRTISLNRETKAVYLTDDYKLSKRTKPIVLNFMTSAKPETGGDNKLYLYTSGKEKKKIILFYPEGFDVFFEPLDINDPVLKNSWGDKVYRIQMVQNKMKKSDIIKISMEPSN